VDKRQSIISDNALLENERATLDALEVTIERGLKTFVTVGSALSVIRDRKLYRETHGTFDDYCRERWGMSRFYAHRTIDAAKVADNLLPMGNIPTSERQARPLTKLEPEQQREVWREAVETAPDGKITAAHVQRTVGKITKPGQSNQKREDQNDTPLHQGNKLSVHHSSKTPEHYTPATIYLAAIRCMGEIDLDPCSNSAEDPNVPAAKHYTEEDDGLSKPWLGRVYMNPPYGRSIQLWVEKLRDEYQAGNTAEAIALLPARTDTQWFRILRDYPICFVEGRLTFIGNDDPAPFPSAIIYLGDDPANFYKTFSHIGDIYQRIKSA